MFGPRPLSSALSTFAAIGLLSGCLVGDDYEGEIGDYAPTDNSDHLVASPSSLPLPSIDEDVDVDALVVGPTEVLVYVGDLLDVDFVLTDDSIELRASNLPEAASFETLEDGARVRWTPQLADIGSHDFIFLIVDAEVPSLVIAQKTLLVDVIPRLGLIEYGF